ncbi:MAG: MFS transporter [Anaerolineae bacterium]
MAERSSTLKTDSFYALITLGNTALWSIVSGWLLYFYLPPDGEGSPLVPAALYGGVMFTVRAVNALIAPAIGHASDNSQNRWGRRLPFMFASALPMLVFFVLLWTPPVNDRSIWNLAYLALIYLLYNFTYTLNQIPYTALLPELALTDEHRVRLSAWTSGAMLVGMIVGGLAGPLVESRGYVVTALVYAAGALPLFYLPFLVLRERPGRRIPAAEKLDFREGLRIMFQNRAFLIMSATGFFYWITTTFVQGVVPYIVTEICRLPVSETMYFMVPAVLGALVSYPLITWMAERWGKNRVFAGSLLASAVVLPGLMLIGERIPLPLRVQGIAWITLQAVTMAGVIMLPPAFGAEITDYDAALTGQRREGAYYAVWGLLDQVINGLATALLPLVLLLGRSHTDPQGPLGVRVIGLLSSVMMLAAFFIFRHYPLGGKATVEAQAHG